MAIVVKILILGQGYCLKIEVFFGIYDISLRALILKFFMGLLISTRSISQCMVYFCPKKPFLFFYLKKHG